MSAQFLAFLAKIDGKIHRAALFKVLPRDVYWWTWFDSNDWYQARVDFRDGKIVPFGRYSDIHNSKHESGEFHVRYVQKQGAKFTAAKQQGRCLMNMGVPISLPRTPIPLDQPFPWTLCQGPWNKVISTVILCPRRFGSMVYLHPYVCGVNDVAGLAKKGSSWVAGTGQIKLVVLGEPH